MKFLFCLLASFYIVISQLLSVCKVPVCLSTRCLFYLSTRSGWLSVRRVWSSYYTRSLCCVQLLSTKSLLSMVSNSLGFVCLQDLFCLPCLHYVQGKSVYSVRLSTISEICLSTRSEIRLSIRSELRLSIRSEKSPLMRPEIRPSLRSSNVHYGLRKPNPETMFLKRLFSIWILQFAECCKYIWKTFLIEILHLTEYC